MIIAKIDIKFEIIAKTVVKNFVALNISFSLSAGFGGKE